MKELLALFSPAQLQTLQVIRQALLESPGEFENSKSKEEVEPA